jgi:hypothetical protein
MNKKGIISLSSVKQETLDSLKAIADKKEITVSNLLRDMIDKFLSMNEEDIIPVILKIPKNLRGNADGLKNWLDSKTSGIVKILST